MFSAFAAGAFFVVTGSIGIDVRHTHALQGSRWADAPIWSQVVLGVALLLLGTFWSRRLGEPQWTETRAARGRMLKNAGQGQSSGARQELRRRNLTDGEPKS